MFDFHLFADDSNLYFTHKNLTYLEQVINAHLSNIYTRLRANKMNKLFLNIKNTNYVIFHPPQKKLSNNTYNQETYVQVILKPIS